MNKEFEEKLKKLMTENYPLESAYSLVLHLIEQYAEEKKAEAKREFLEEIIQDMFNATALSIPMDYIYDLKKKLQEKK